MEVALSPVVQRSLEHIVYYDYPELHLGNN